MTAYDRDGIFLGDGYYLFVPKSKDLYGLGTDIEERRRQIKCFGAWRGFTRWPGA